jgi:hypothetical protein
LLRERARADRTGSPLVVVSLGATGSNGRQTEPRRLQELIAQSVTECFRLTDVKGWSARRPGHVAVMMPDTPRHHVYKPLRRVEDHFHRGYWQNYGRDARVPELSCTVFIYPGETAKADAVDAGVGSPMMGIHAYEDTMHESETVRIKGVQNSVRHIQL